MKWSVEAFERLTTERTELRERISEKQTLLDTARNAYRAAKSAFKEATDETREALRTDLDDAMFEVSDARNEVSELRAQERTLNESVSAMEKLRPKSGRVKRQNVGIENDLLRQIAKAGDLEKYADRAVAEEVAYTDWKTGQPVQTKDVDAERMKDYLASEGLITRATEAQAAKMRAALEAGGSFTHARETLASSADNVALTPFQVGSTIVYSLTDFGGLLQHINLVRTADGAEMRAVTGVLSGSIDWGAEGRVVDKQDVEDPHNVKIGRHVGHLGSHFISTQAMQDPRYDVTGHVLNVFAEREAQGVNAAIWSGSGAANNPTGIKTALADSTTQVVKSGVAAGVTQASLANLTKETVVPERYFGQTLENGPGAGFMNATPPAGFGGTPGSYGLFMRRSTYLTLIQEAGSDEHYKLANAISAMMGDDYLWGRKVHIAQGVDPVAANNFSVLYGNLGYYLFRLVGGSRIRFVDGLAAQNKDGVVVYGFCDGDGKPIDEKAMGLLQSKA